VKCLDKFAEFRRRNKTILLVTHSLDLVEKFCDRALWLDRGKTLAEGDPRRVVASYLIDVEKSEEEELTAAEAARLKTAAVTPGTPDSGGEAAPVDSNAPTDMFTATEGRWGSREVGITQVSLTDGSGQPSHVFQSGEPIQVHFKVRAHQPTSDFVFGFGLFNADGICCYGTNTYIEELQPDELSGDGEVTFSISHLDLVEGTYKVDVAAHKLDGYPYDYHRLLYTFRVKSRSKDVGIYRPDHKWSFSPAIRFK
jgi:hypothetical protein